MPPTLTLIPSSFDHGPWATHPELSYRRGVQQGAAQMLYALHPGASLDDLRRWVFRDLYDWRFGWTAQGIKAADLPREIPPYPPILRRG